MRVHTYHIEETERPTAELTEANILRFFAAPTVLVKINPIHIVDNNGRYSTWICEDILTSNIIRVLRNNNPVFTLLAGSDIALGQISKDFFGTAEYILFTRSNNGVYNMSFHDADYGLPPDIVELRAAGKEAKEARRKYNGLRRAGKMSDSLRAAYAEAFKAKERLMTASMISLRSKNDEHAVIVNTRSQLYRKMRKYVSDTY